MQMIKKLLGPICFGLREIEITRWGRVNLTSVGKGEFVMRGFQTYDKRYSAGASTQQV